MRAHDGKPEAIAEAYDLVQLVPWVDVTVDSRFFAAPSDDAAHEPVSVVSPQGHVETTVGNGT